MSSENLEQAILRLSHASTYIERALEQLPVGHAGYSNELQSYCASIEAIHNRLVEIKEKM